MFIGDKSERATVVREGDNTPGEKQTNEQ